MGKSRGTANSNAIQLQGRRKEPEELLWIAVLSKAADDALFTTDYREALLAINWFEGEGRDFRYVCHLANRDPNYVLRKILSSMGTMDAIEFLLSKLKNTKNNADFFVSMNKPAK